MPEDFRVSTGWHDHPKTVKLERALGEVAPLALLRLWAHATKNKPSGALTGMDPEDVAIAAKWRGDADEFVAALVRIGWLEDQDGVLVLHDWADHNGFVATAPERSEQAREAARTRWGGKPKKAAASESHAGRIDQHVRPRKSAHAPSPSPNPSPSPSPDRSDVHARERAPAHASEPPAGNQGWIDVDVTTPAATGGLPKGPEVPYTAEQLAAIAAALPAGTLCRPDQAPAQMAQLLRHEFPAAEYQLVHARWRELGPGGQAAWTAEALSRPEVQAKKMADRWKSAMRHVGRALADGFDLLTEEREAKVVAHPAAAPPAYRPRAGAGRMNNQERNMDVLARAAAAHRAGGGA